MSLKMAPYYWLVCDDCGAKSTECTNRPAWPDPDTATTAALVQYWFCGDYDWCGRCRNNHVCNECDKVTDDLVPLDGDSWMVCRECEKDKS